MIARQPAERRVKPRRVVTPYFDATRAQVIPEGARSLTEAAHPVVDQAHPHTVPRFRDKRVSKPQPGTVFVNDVALEVDVMFRIRDSIEPGGIILSCVNEQTNAVSFDERRT